MSTDAQGTSPVDLEAEQEIDLRSAWTRIRARWWIPLVGLVVGAVVGVVFAAGAETVYDAKGLLYMGQPFTPAGGGQLQSLQTNPRTVTEVITSESSLDAAAEASGLTRAQLRGNVTSAPVTITQGATARNLSPLIEIRVKAPKRDAAEAAATSLSNSVIEAVRGYTDSKVKLLETQIAVSSDGLERVERRLDRAYAQQEALATSTSLPAAERLIVQQSINATIAASEAQRITLQSDINGARQLLGLANEVERPSLVQPPVAVKTQATSSRNAAIVGGLVGLLLGALVAYAVDPVLRRRAAQAAG
jgi:hypothetical protein